MDESRILSLPIQLHWGGWTADTRSLQRNGWQLSAYQDVMMRQMRIALKHPVMEMQGITTMGEFDYHSLMYENHYRPIDIGMSIGHMGRTIMISEMNMPNVRFNPIDAEPRIVEQTIRTLDDIAHFQTIQRPEHEVFLKEASMAEILDMALQKQEPKQAEIRARMRKEEELKRYGKFHTALNII